MGCIFCAWVCYLIWWTVWVTVGDYRFVDLVLGVGSVLCLRCGGWLVSVQMSLLTFVCGLWWFLICFTVDFVDFVDFGCACWGSRLSADKVGSCIIFRS